MIGDEFWVLVLSAAFFCITVVLVKVKNRVNRLPILESIKVVLDRGE